MNCSYCFNMGHLMCEIGNLHWLLWYYYCHQYSLLWAIYHLVWKVSWHHRLLWIPFWISCCWTSRLWITTKLCSELSVPPTQLSMLSQSVCLFCHLTDIWLEYTIVYTLDNYLLQMIFLRNSLQTLTKCNNMIFSFSSHLIIYSITLPRRGSMI